jgi:hypothetical protein
MVVHTANIIHATSLFQSDNMGNNSDKENKQRGCILHNTIQIFCTNNQAGDTSLNILDSPPQAVQGCIIILGQHDNPQVFTAGQPIIHSIIQIQGDDISMHPLHDPKTSSDATSSTTDVAQLLIIQNSEIGMAPFEELDFLAPPQPATPYEPYPGSPLPNFDYWPCMPTPEFIKELGVMPGDEWLHNIKGLSPTHDYSIPGLGGRAIQAPFYKYDFLSDYPKILLSQGHNCLQHLHPLRVREDPYPWRVLTQKEAYTFYPAEMFTPMVDFTIHQE